MKHKKSELLKGREYCADREFLQKAHREDVSVWKETLSRGEDFCDDLVKIDALMKEISRDDYVSQDDKEPILVQLKLITDYLQSSYTRNIEIPLRDVSESLDKRIDNISAATNQRKMDVQRMERMIWNTKAVNKHQLIQVYNDLYTRYKFLFEETSCDLYLLMKETTEQRNRIRKYTTKR